MGVRKPAVAGTFYPGSEELLRSMIHEFMQACKKMKFSPKALIVPHAGYVYSGIVAAAGYHLLQGKTYERVILLGPSHRLPFYGAAFDSSQSWETPLGNVPVSNFYAEHIKILPQAHVKEHSIEVQLPFLQYVLKDFSIAPIAMGSSAPIQDDLQNALSDKTLFVVSSDLSHYHDYDTAKSMDGQTIDKIRKLTCVNYEEACGADGINALIALAKKNKWTPALVEYKNSGDTAGDKKQVVGYACIAFS
ncbi:MAG: AmmeMemoRadiSam system protein B [archaeon]